MFSSVNNQVFNPFVYGIRQWPSLILLHVDVQFSQSPFVEEVILFPLYTLNSIES